MLRKILEDMFVPEEILSNISDDDKQLIFIEIRKEQIRRYNSWQSTDKSSEEFHHKPNLKGKNIKFADDNELVSFLGERPFDKTIEEILRDETLRRAHEEAEKAIQAELDVSISDKADLVQISETVEQVAEEVNPAPKDNIPISSTPEPVSRTPPAKPPKPVTKRLSKTTDQKREELLKRKSTEIYHTLISQHSVLEETAAKENEELTPFWEKAAEQARIDDELRRKKAVEARKFYENIGKERVQDETDAGVTQTNSTPPPLPSRKSSQLRHVLNAISNFEITNKRAADKNGIKLWFLENEWNKKKIVDKSTNKVPDWFHGMISREQCEKLLANMDIGSFMIRVSEKCLCYVLSYKTKSKMKHILIQSNTDCDRYEFVGPPNVTVFKSLSDLINHFQTHYLNDISHDILTTACGQVPGTVVDYMALIQPDSSQDDNKLIHKCTI